mmetsp:Transcript_29204/g.33752  ORF Transcript_29204/g.33752 Transcript_29204/m.33752 type:complete len:119 (-) Transcript_29204:218-574(-)
MNHPDKRELFVLPEGKRKVELLEDTKIPYAATLTIYLEDHTLGNIARMQLLKNKNVRFAGYRKPHPLENKIEVKIQTNGKIRPTEAFITAIEEIQADIRGVSSAFDKELTRYKNERNF